MELKASRFKALLKSLLTGAPCQHVCQNSAKALMEHLTSLRVKEINDMLSYSQLKEISLTLQKRNCTREANKHEKVLYFCFLDKTGQGICLPCELVAITQTVKDMIHIIVTNRVILVLI